MDETVAIIIIIAVIIFLISLVIFFNKKKRESRLPPQHYPPRRTRKKFEIHPETSQTIEQSIANPSFEGARNNFVIQGETRSKICPYCRSHDQITRLPSGTLQCKVCDHEWNGGN